MAEVLKTSLRLKTKSDSKSMSYLNHLESQDVSPQGFQGLPNDPELPALSWAASSGEGMSVLPVLFVLVNGNIGCI